jgi:hypothetical protein
MTRETEPVRRTRGQGTLRRGLSALLAVGFLLSATPVVADEFDDDTAGHPLRIVAYVLHPIGVAVEYLLFRPAHWLVSQEPMKTLFGHED